MESHSRVPISPGPLAQGCRLVKRREKGAATAKRAADLIMRDAVPGACPLSVVAFELELMGDATPTPDRMAAALFAASGLAAALTDIAREAVTMSSSGVSPEWIVERQSALGLRPTSWRPDENYPGMRQWIAMEFGDLRHYAEYLAEKAELLSLYVATMPEVERPATLLLLTETAHNAEVAGRTFAELSDYVGPKRRAHLWREAAAEWESKGDVALASACRRCAEDQEARVGTWADWRTRPPQAAP
jgi:hypothetical protein